jgi:hypothetical protein
LSTPLSPRHSYTQIFSSELHCSTPSAEYSTLDITILYQNSWPVSLLPLWVTVCTLSVEGLSVKDPNGLCCHTLPSHLTKRCHITEYCYLKKYKNWSGAYVRNSCHSHRYKPPSGKFKLTFKLRFKTYYWVSTSIQAIWWRYISVTAFNYLLNSLEAICLLLLSAIGIQNVRF